MRLPTGRSVKILSDLVPICAEGTTTRNQGLVMPRDMNKPAEYTAEQEKLLLSQYHAVGPAAINAALQCKTEKPAPAPKQSPYDTQTD